MVNNKRSMYFPDDLIKEIEAEAKRQDRSLSWIVQQAWRVARDKMKATPSASEVLSDHG